MQRSDTALNNLGFAWKPQGALLSRESPNKAVEASLRSALQRRANYIAPQVRLRQRARVPTRPTVRDRNQGAPHSAGCKRLKRPASMESNPQSPVAQVRSAQLPCSTRSRQGELLRFRSDLCRLGWPLAICSDQAKLDVRDGKRRRTQTELSPPSWLSV